MPRQRAGRGLGRFLAGSAQARCSAWSALAWSRRNPSVAVRPTGGALCWDGVRRFLPCGPGGARRRIRGAEAVTPENAPGSTQGTLAEDEARDARRAGSGAYGRG